MVTYLAHKRETNKQRKVSQKRKKIKKNNRHVTRESRIIKATQLGGKTKTRQKGSNDP